MKKSILIMTVSLLMTMMVTGQTTSFGDFGTMEDPVSAMLPLENDLYIGTTGQANVFTNVAFRYNASGITPLGLQGGGSNQFISAIGVNENNEPIFYLQDSNPHNNAYKYTDNNFTTPYYKFIGRVLGNYKNMPWGNYTQITDQQYTQITDHQALTFYTPNPTHSQIFQTVTGQAIYGITDHTDGFTYFCGTNVNGTGVKITKVLTSDIIPGIQNHTIINMTNISLASNVRFFDIISYNGVLYALMATGGTQPSLDFVSINIVNNDITVTTIINILPSDSGNVSFHKHPRMQIYDDKLYIGYDKLWVYDGTNINIIKSFDSGQIRSMVVYDNKLVFGGDFQFTEGGNTYTNLAYLKIDEPVADFSYTNNTNVCTFDFTSNSTNETSYLWDFSNGDTSTDQNPTGIVFDPGVYTVQLTVTNIGGSDTYEQEIAVDEIPLTGLTGTLNGEPITEFTEITNCSGSDFILSLSLNNVWSDEINTYGVHNITVTDDNNCKGYLDVNIIELALPIPTINIVSNICGGESGLIELVNCNSYNITWNNSSTECGLETSTAGVYSVTVTDINGCVGSNSVDIVAYTNPILSIDTEYSFCPTTTDIEISEEDEFQSYNWLNGDNVISTSNTAVVSNEYSGFYSLTVTDINGCISTSDFIVYIHEVTQPIITHDGNNTLLISNDWTEDYENYQWFINGEALSNETNSTYMLTNSGDYTVEVTDTNGCVSLSESYIHNQSTASLIEYQILGNKLITQNNWVLYDMSGRTILSGTPGEYTIASGVYLIKTEYGTDKVVFWENY
jgi:hypothetical protein